ncbi:MAG: xanthine dehydrogenase family protein molybdopterin-binding subunit [Verrucomicrobia bacterium]|nr:xanthine dehydrogenase family protein molybdopterin-binding subunit [Verrucomicrobiota bacterium]
MKTSFPELEFTEPERYELHEGPFYHFEVSRREFVQVLGAGILISVAVPSAFAQRSGRGGGTANLAQRLHLGADGMITVFTSKVEVGQGSRTQLTQAAAEELGVPVDRIRLIMADTAQGPDDGGTAGSRTTPSTVPAIRRDCAAARQLLVNTASTAFNIETKGLSVRNGLVEGLGSDRRFGYADLASEKYAQALKRDAGSGVAVTEVAQWRVLGTAVPRVGAVEIATGAHRFPSDIVRPGMLYGKVLRSPSYGAELTEIDLGPAQALPDVAAVRDGDFVGFAAPTSFAAEQARDAAAKTAKWKIAPHPSSDELYDYLRAHATSPRPRRDLRGSPDDALKTASKVLRETYHVAYIQHAPMEPRSAVAEWKEGNLTVWTGSQQPARVRQDLARSLRIPQERVRVIVPDSGGGFGGKHSGEVAVEAARLALAAKRPVSIRWSREDEFTWAYFRPAGVIDVAGGLDDKGTLVAWEHVNFNSGASAIATPYEVPNIATEFKSCDQPLRSGSYRALASTANAFARESFMDELAAASKTDPLEFRLRHLKNDRLRAVLVAAAERFGWRNEWKLNSARQSIGVGLACGTEKGSYVACCAKIQVDERAGTFKVLKVCEAFECGAIQNPGNLQAQVEGCIVMGLGGALREEIRFKDGKILNPMFSQYRVPRFKDVPEIETILVNRPDLSSVGAGETPIIGIAPAVANALFNAAQVRIRSLPIRNAALRAST